MNHSTIHTAKEGSLVLFKGPGQDLEMNTFKVPVLAPGEILVKNLYTTICGSDLHTYCGMRNEPCPTVLGHEIVGVILEIDPDHGSKDLNGKELAKGDFITWSIFSSDPESPNSIAGMPQKGNKLFKYGHAIAEEPDVFNGGLSEFCILKPHTGILKLSENIPLSVACTLNCSVSTVAGALRLAGNLHGKNVLITGMGHLGITCAAMCKDAGAKWVGAADITEKRLGQALDFGADELFNLSEQNGSPLPGQKFLGKEIDVAFDMSGSPVAMELGLDSLGIGGTAVWVGAVFKTRNVEVNPEKIIRSLISIKGLHNYNFSDFRYALDFMERNWQKYPFEKVVEQEFSLSNAQNAFEYAIKHKPLRVGVKI